MIIKHFICDKCKREFNPHDEAKPHMTKITSEGFMVLSFASVVDSMRDAELCQPCVKELFEKGTFA